MPNGTKARRTNGMSIALNLDRWLSRDWRAATLVRESPELAASAVAANLLSLALPIMVLQVYDRIIPNNAIGTLLLCLIGMVAVLGLDAFLSIARAYIVGWNTARMQHKLSNTALERLIGSDTKHFEQNNVGSYIQSLRAVDTLRGFHSGQPLLLWIDIPFAIIFLMLIGLIGGPIVIAPIAILLIVAYLAHWSGTALRDALEKRTGNDSRRHSFMIDVLAKIGTAKALGMESLLIRRYERLQRQSANANYHTVLYSVLARSIGIMMSQVMMVVVAAAGGALVISGSMSIGSLAACTLLAGRIGSPLMRLLNIWTQYQSMTIARRQINGVLALPQEAAPDGIASQSQRNAGDHESEPAFEPGIIGAISFERVTYSYVTQSPLLKDVNFEIEPSTTIGITGPNATGKSSLLHLMAGLLRPDSGSVTIDGRVISDFPLEPLRSQICYLPQHPVLFEGTILENLTAFRTEDRLDRAHAISESLGLGDNIARLPEGFDTKIGIGSNDSLPIGLRQRIAVARALIAVERPRIILFDEANALLDKQSDEILIRLLRQYKGEATIVVVSHRPAVLNLADRVFALKDGMLTPYNASQLPAPAPRQREGAA